MQDGPAGPALRIITGLTIVAWGLQMLFWPLEYAALVAGFVPARFVMDVPALDIIPRFLTPLSATLVHGGFLHLLMKVSWLNCDAITRVSFLPSCFRCPVIIQISSKDFGIECFVLDSSIQPFHSLTVHVVTETSSITSSSGNHHTKWLPSS